MADENHKHKRKVEDIEKDITQIRKKLKITRDDLYKLEEELQSVQNEDLIPWQSKIPSFVASSKQVVLIKDSILGSYWNTNQDKHKDDIKTRHALINIPVCRELISKIPDSYGGFENIYSDWQYVVHYNDDDSFYFYGKYEGDNFEGKITTKNLINSPLLDTLHHDPGVIKMIQSANIKANDEETQSANFHVDVWILTRQDVEDADEEEDDVLLHLKDKKEEDDEEDT